MEFSGRSVLLHLPIQRESTRLQHSARPRRFQLFVVANHSVQRHELGQIGAVLLPWGIDRYAYFLDLILVLWQICPLFCDPLGRHLQLLGLHWRCLNLRQTLNTFETVLSNICHGFGQNSALTH